MRDAFVHYTHDIISICCYNGRCIRSAHQNFYDYALYKLTFTFTSSTR